MPRNPVSQAISEAEHTIVGEIADACQRAHDAMLQMSQLRADQRNLWEKAAVNMKLLQGQMYDLATGGQFTAEDGKFGGGPTH